MGFHSTIRGTRYAFADLRTLLAKATPARSGDMLAGIAAASAQERVAAQRALADLPLRHFLHEWVIPPEEDDVTRLILAQHDAAAFAPVASLTVGALRDWLLAATPAQVAGIARGLTPEMAAAVTKLCRVADMVSIARKCQVRTRFRDSLGDAGTLAIRLQPNHPTDDARGVAAAILDGLLLGAGDACIGINPATDNLDAVRRLLDLLAEVILRYDIPTQGCVLCHVTTSMMAMEAGAPVDLVFQSIGGTQRTNESFGVSLALLEEARQAAQARHPGANVMYFETGQGSALSADAHHGVDQQTVEARAYAVARQYDPLLVNSVVGFIGPEYLFDGKQILRAGLEDHCCGKLLGLPMGVDICHTNHAEADPDDMDALLLALAAAGVNYIMGVPGTDDVMLAYQSTSFQDGLTARALAGRGPAPEFAAWLERMGIGDGSRIPAALSPALIGLG